MPAYFLPADILLPDFGVVNGTAYATVACDQYTSDPEYWRELSERVGAAPSTLRMILPEAFLPEAEARIPAVHKDMEDYLKSGLIRYPNSMIYLERTLSDGKVRRGLIGMIDLELYDYRPGAKSLIRPTEETVPERIPPRLEVRRGAALELPHVLLLLDDPGRSVIEPQAARLSALTPAYDFPLLPGAGSVRAFFLDSIGIGRVTSALSRLVSPERQRQRYGAGCAPLLFAVGDGNHSLAVAKAAYEEVKAELGEEALFHPARYALAEVVNLYDPALRFEPIYRVLTGVDPDEVLSALENYSYAQHGTLPPQQIRFLSARRRGTMHFGHPSCPLPVDTLGHFLHGYLNTHPGAAVDYIHGARTVEGLAAHENTVGFLFEGLPKEKLFETVMNEGTLPRKTFSMGHAEDKRFYIEARRIR